MFSGMFGSTTRPPTRLQRCEELKQIVDLFARLNAKVNKLGEAGSKLGAATIDYRKHCIMSALLDLIAQRIALFNLQSGHPGDAEKLLLVCDIANSIDRIRAAYGAILAWPRDQQREIADISLTTGVYGLSLAAAAVLPFATVGTLLAFFYAAPWLSNKARVTTGLNNHRTASIQLLDEWQSVLQALQVNLEFRVVPAERIENSDKVCPAEYICPITDEIMKEPYICKLDGRTYEHASILRALTDNRRSPLNNVELIPGQSPDDVLCLNRNLQDLIEKFKAEHPDFIYQEDAHPSTTAAAAAAATITTTRPGC